MSPVLPTDTDDARTDAVALAASAVRDGRLVVLPTDTVYGLGADAFDPAAVSALLAAKGRGRAMPPPVLVPEIRTVAGLATDVPGWATRLMETYWPGPLTLVLHAQASLAWDLGDSNGTVALRMPDEPVALELLAATGPLAVSSANLHAQPAATSVVDAAAMLGSSVAVYLDGGPSRGGLSSTIVDCTGEEPVVLRAGAICEGDVRRTAGFPVAGEEPSEPAAPDDDVVL